MRPEKLRWGLRFVIAAETHGPCIGSREGLNQRGQGAERLLRRVAICCRNISIQAHRKWAAPVAPDGL